MSNARLSIVDASGKSMASNVAVPANGNYGPIALASGTGPFRLAACGYVVDRYTCLYSVTQAGGTTQITPLTSAIVLLATGAPPSLAGNAPSGLAADAVAAAQSQLQASIAPALADAGLASNADLLGGPLVAGSRTGYDRLLDNVAVTLGQDGSGAFVQLEPRMGSGSVTLGTSSNAGGAMTVDAGAAALDLGGINSLFGSMSAAMASATACDADMPALMAPGARLTIGNISFNDQNVASGLCNAIGSGIFSDGSIAYGSKLVGPQLGRCDFSGGGAVCRVSLIAQTPGGALLPLAQNQAIAWQGGGSWLFLGDMQSYPTSAEARVQLLRRVDGAAQVDSYVRSIGVGVSTLWGASCVRVLMKDTGGNDHTLAYMKPANGAASNLSVWTVDAVNGQPSLDPLTGAVRGSDDRWIALPDGAAGDAIVRSGGHLLTVELYSDDACSASLTPRGSDSSAIMIELPVLPPLSAALASQPWPTLSAPAVTALTGLKANAGTKPALSASWTLPSPPPALNLAQLCLDSLCTTSGLIASQPLAPAATSATVTATANVTNAVAATDFKQLRLNARNADGVLLQADFQSCPAATPGGACAVSQPLAQGARSRLRRASR